MAAEFEVFNKLRNLGKSLDKISNILPDNAVKETNRARATLQLKALLTEAKNFKKEVKQNIADAESRFNLDNILELCTKQACKIREDIENLEEHLTKYGYKRTQEKLPTIPLDSEEEFNVVDNEQCNGESPISNSSDKENHLPTHEEMNEVENAEKELVKQSHLEDPLATPIRPVTVTKFIDFLAPNTTEIAQKLQSQEEPCPPLTTTPLLRPRQNFDKDPRFNTPDYLESPAPPATQTPMIKGSINFDSPLNDTQELSSVDNLPTPPTFTTPGLKRYGLEQDCTKVSMHFDALKTPPPPNVTSVLLLNPDDIVSTETAPPTNLKLPADFEQQSQKTINLLEISFNEYLQLPDSVQRQIPLEQLNGLIRQTNDYLNMRSKGASSTVTNEELASVLHLGPSTCVFALAMLKLDYFIMKKAGVYYIRSSNCFFF